MIFLAEYIPPSGQSSKLRPPFLFGYCGAPVKVVFEMLVSGFIRTFQKIKKANRA